MRFLLEMVTHANQRIRDGGILFQMYNDTHYFATKSKLVTLGERSPVEL